MVDEINDEIDSIIRNKESEIKNIYNSKIKQLQNIISEKEGVIKVLDLDINDLKKKFEYNLKLIEERDNDLKIYEDKIDSFILLINEKDAEIKKISYHIEELQSRLSNERAKKESEIEMLKYKINQINLQHKEEIKSLNIKIKDSEKLMEEVKFQNEKNIKDSNNNYENELKNIIKENEKLKEILNDKKYKENLKLEEEGIINRKLEEMNHNFNKINNENLNMIRDKVQLESKLKILENNENEIRSNNTFIIEKNKLIMKELEEVKLELSNKILKIDNMSKIHEDMNIEIHNLKQKISLKEFEIEKKNLSERIQNEKLKDIVSALDKVTEEKRNICKELDEERLKVHSIEHKNKLVMEEMNFSSHRNVEEGRRLIEENRKLNENIIILKKEIDDLNIKIKLNIKESKEQNSDIEDFFKNNASNILNNKSFDKYERTIKEKDREIEILRKEIDGFKEILDKAEEEMRIQFELFKSENNKLKEDKEQLKLEMIRKSIEIKNSVSNEDLLRLKEELLERNNEIKSLREVIDKKASELNKVKKERDKLANISKSLRAEVNRLENTIKSNGMNSENDNIEYEYDYNFNNDKPDLDYEEIRMKKDSIMGKENDIKIETRQCIENIFNDKSNGINRPKSNNMDKRSQSPNKSTEDLSDLIKISKLRIDKNNFIHNNHKNDQNDNIYTISTPNIKLLKRNRAKS